MKGVDITKSKCLQHSEDISNKFNGILRKINVDKFWFIRIYYDDNSRLILTNFPEWIEYFYKQGLYKDDNIIRAEFLQEPGFYSWDFFRDELPFVEGKEKFMISKGGVTILRKNDTYSDIYCFSKLNETSLGIDIVNQWHTLLERFIFYFKENIDSLINDLSKSRINLNDLYYKNVKYLTLKLGTFEKEAIESFLKETVVKKIFLTDGKYLTNRESVCIKYMLNGHSAKETAKLLNISNRTVEAYISNVKRKFDFNRVHEIFKILCEFNFESLSDSALLENFDIQKKLSE